MNEEGIPQAAPAEDDVNTTPPNPPANDNKAGWSMPEPVFRKTSGYLPQGYEGRFPQDDPGDEVAAPDAGYDELSSVAPAAAVEPQPDIHDTSDGHGAAIAEAAPVPKKSSGGKVVLVIFGVLFALALVGLFIAVIYYLFLMPVPSGPFE